MDGVVGVIVEPHQGERYGLRVSQRDAGTTRHARDWVDVAASGVLDATTRARRSSLGTHTAVAGHDQSAVACRHTGIVQKNTLCRIGIRGCVSDRDAAERDVAAADLRVADVQADAGTGSDGVESGRGERATVVEDDAGAVGRVVQDADVGDDERTDVGGAVDCGRVVSSKLRP